MPATTTAAREYEQAYRRRSDLPGGKSVEALRDVAFERFAELGFPTTHDEEWKYTSLAPYIKTAYEPALARTLAALPADAPFADLGSPRLVFVNGRLAPQLSSPTTAFARGLKVRSLAEALAHSKIAALVASEAKFERNAMAALNTALFEDGAYIEIADGAVIEQPIHLVFVSAHEGRRGVTYPRNLIVAGRDSQAQIVETYFGLDQGEYFTNTVTELIAADGAILNHYKIQAESEAALHFGLLAVRQGGSSNVASHNIALGAALARNEIGAVLDGEGAECTMNGLYVTTGRRHVDNYTTLDHAKPHCTSHELYKGILDGKSQGVFHGRIIVRQEAQKTDAIQRNKNLLLSDAAVINTKPQLEIYADDVKCTHGATVGQVDPDAVFYLRSRGIPLAAARALLTYAFTADVLAAIKVEPIRSGLGASLFRQLAAGGGVDEHEV